MKLARSVLAIFLSVFMSMMLTACGQATSPVNDEDVDQQELSSSSSQDTNTEENLDTTAADSDLEAILEAPATVQYNDDDPMVVYFTLVNHSDESLYVLEWYTPLEGIAGEIFAVERDGESLPYEGIQAFRDNPTPDSYVLLGAGESVSAEADLSSSYDLSQPGLYTVEFLSPRISHIARSESEMATTVNELGPVTIPSNTIEIRIEAPAGASLSRPVPPDEAARRIRAYLLSEREDLAEDFILSVEEIPDQTLWEQLQIQVFRVTEGDFLNESYLLTGDRVLPMGIARDGRGVTSMAVSDLDGDGTSELLFTFGAMFDSGIYQSRVRMYAPAYSATETFEADTGFFDGDIGLLANGPADVAVRVVQADDDTLTLRYLDTLGHLSIQTQADRSQFVLDVNPDLTEEVQDKLFTVQSEP